MPNNIISTTNCSARTSTKLADNVNFSYVGLFYATSIRVSSLRRDHSERRAAALRSTAEYSNEVLIHALHVVSIEGDRLLIA